MSHAAPDNGLRWRLLVLTCLAVVGTLTTWFSATAILPALTAVWDLSTSQAAWLTNAVQLGFVVGALASSFVNLPDIVQLNRLMAAAGTAAALANAGLLVAPGPEAAIALRFATGVALAGVYPPALKLMSTWFRRGRGLAMGFLIGALTLGSSMPHLFRALGNGLDWHLVVALSSAAALISALLSALALREGPHGLGRATFDPRQALRVLRNRPLMLANVGYFGHMWELYAMWAWFLAYSSAAQGEIPRFPLGSPSMLTFAVVGVGAAGCVLGGVLSDRIGRCRTTTLMLVISGASALLIGVAFDGPGWLFALVALVWGVFVVGDSAQFSTAVTELADPRFIGTAVALQLGIGFALTVVAIWVMPLFAEAIGGWRWAFLLLVPGPVIGAFAMIALRRRPEAAQMAQGLR